MKISNRLLTWSSALLLGTTLLHAQPADPSRTPYVHDFSDGHGGWNSDRRSAIHILDGVAHCHSPWFVDANHAPPGAGYLHLVFWILTDKRWYQPDQPGAATLPYRTSSFAEQGKSKDLRGAKITVRMRGKVDLKDAKLVLLAQAQTAKTTANIVLNSQPLTITEDWSDQTIVLANDPKQWVPLGGSKNTMHKYGYDELDTVLSDVNIDLIFVLFPLRIEPATKGVADIHAQIAGYDYPVDTQHLPTGLIQVKSIRIDYPTK